MAKLLVTLMASLAALFASRTSTGQAVVILPLPAHVLNRITYGPSLALLQSLSLQTTGGPSNVDIYIGRQIALSGKAGNKRAQARERECENASVRMRVRECK